ncbi:hypothetical protein E2320_004636, partial [Naja naja]
EKYLDEGSLAKNNLQILSKQQCKVNGCHLYPSIPWEDPSYRNAKFME